MKIEIHAPGGPDMSIPVPNAMLFSPTLVNLWLKFGVRCSDQTVPQIPPAAVKQACRAIKAYRKKSGPWELVRVESADGATVTITV